MDPAWLSDCDSDFPPDNKEASSLMSLANMHLSKHCLTNEVQSPLMSLASQHLSKYNINNSSDSANSTMTLFIPNLPTNVNDNNEGNMPDIGGLIITCQTAAEEHSDSFNSEIAEKNNSHPVLEEEASPDDYIIDLTVALIKSNLNEPVISLPVIEPAISEEIVFNPPTELIKEVKSVIINPLPCLFYSPEIPRKKLFNKGSPMSKVICAKYQEREILKIDHKYHDTYGNLKFFKFDTPCPDEVILRNLKMKKPPPTWVEIFNKL